MCYTIDKNDHVMFEDFKKKVQDRLEAVHELIKDGFIYREAFENLYLNEPDMTSPQTRFATRLSWEHALYAFWLQKIKNLLIKDSKLAGTYISTSSTSPANGRQTYQNLYDNISELLVRFQVLVVDLFKRPKIPAQLQFEPAKTSVPTQPLGEILVELCTAKHIVHDTEFWDIVEDLPDEHVKTVASIFDKLRILTCKGMDELNGWVSPNLKEAVSTLQPSTILVCYLCFATGSSNHFPNPHPSKQTEIRDALHEVRRKRAQEKDVNDKIGGRTSCSKLQGHVAQAWNRTLDPKAACETCRTLRPYEELFKNKEKGKKHRYEACAEWPSSHHCYWMERLVFENQGLNFGGFEGRETCRNFLVQLRKSRYFANRKGSLENNDS